jgi:hypothetical protein
MTAHKPADPGRTADPVRLLVCARRRAGLGRGEFQQRWLALHRDLARRLPAAGITAYLQNHIYEAEFLESFRELRGGMEADGFDAITEVAFDTMPENDNASGKALEQLLDAEMAFPDTGARRLLLVREHQVFMDSVAPGATVHKMIICVRRRPELSREAFQRYWREEHGPLALALRRRGLTPPMIGYVQNHTLEHPAIERYADGADLYDGVATVWLDRSDDLDLRGTTEQQLLEADRMLVDDEAKFVAPKRSTVCMAVEQVIR